MLEYFANKMMIVEDNYFHNVLTWLSWQTPNLVLFCYNRNQALLCCPGGLQLLASSDPPTSVSQSARIADVNHHAWSQVFLNLVVPKSDKSGNTGL